MSDYKRQHDEHVLVQLGFCLSHRYPKTELLDQRAGSLKASETPWATLRSPRALPVSLWLNEGALFSAPKPGLCVLISKISSLHGLKCSSLVSFCDVFPSHGPSPVFSITQHVFTEHLSCAMDCHSRGFRRFTRESVDACPVASQQALGAFPGRTQRTRSCHFLHEGDSSVSVVLEHVSCGLGGRGQDSSLRLPSLCKA